MSDQVPLSVSADGNLKVLWVPAIADTTAPTIDEVTALEVVELSCYLTADGWTPATDEQVSNDDRLCSKQTFEKRGRYTDTLSVTYVYQGQELTAEDNKAQATMQEGEAGFVVARWGADYAVPMAVADVVDVYTVECGIPVKQAPEANARLRIMQKLFVTNTTQRDKAIVAS
ncbi:hypothetical protein [Glycomyces tenuis]|uniref:phage tail tube protein n=1 Tax=Glycomyces tenuis TaxID=58116 RepID=UPI0003F9BF78|nr:hypothetical protein [Glycomyces tenuis]